MQHLDQGPYQKQKLINMITLPVSKKYQETATVGGKENIPNIFTTRRTQGKTLQKTELSLVFLTVRNRKSGQPQSRVPKYFKSFFFSCTAFVQYRILHRDLLGRCKLCTRCWRHLCKI